MDLLAVYVALDTQTPAVMGEREDEPEIPDWLDRFLEPRPLTALEAAARERQMVLLGDPGSGKSTFADYLALCLAGARLERLGKTSALPGGGWLAHLEPAWTHGPLLPLQITLRHFARSDWCDGTAAGLWNFVAGTLADQGLVDFAPHLRQQLLDGGVMVLLDGLDEVADPEKRRAVRNAVDDFAATYGHPTNRYLVTCRGYAYQDPLWQLDRFAAHTLAPFNQKQIDEFIGCWYKEVCRLGWKSEVEAEDLTRRLQTATRRPDLAPLARSPLQLTMMASLHFSWGRLPEDRVELYQQMVELLLVRWQEARLGEDVGVTQMVSAGKLESALEQVAFTAHHAQERPKGTADVGEEVLRSVLKDYLEGSWDRAGELVTYIQERAGLLIERRPGVYTFPHRSYQEYLAGSYLAVQPGFPDEAASLIRENYAQWREVVLWAVGVMARLKRMIHVAVDVAAALCPREVPDRAVSEADWRAADLASEVLLEIGLKEVKARERHEQVLARVQRWLVALIERGALTPVGRAADGDALARLGDPRPGVGLRADGLPDVVWCEVPAGTFLMGSNKIRDPQASDWEFPQHEVTLPAYSISKYPVTNFQYAAFVQDGGYTEKWHRCWTKAGWRWRGDLAGPETCGGVFDLPNHPVVGVSWYEVMAFCRWLTERLRETGDVGPDQEIMLPTEAQWEKAARGGDGRIFPWGNKFDAAKCNMKDTGIGTTSAVGMFPSGASPYSVLDLSGNVCEWCSSLHRGYLYDPEDGREDLEARDDRVVRGGSFDGNRSYARCACRIRDVPYPHSRYFGFRLCLVSQRD
jgi:formylglycine-generating enzyme required for sulfatase activity